MSLQTILISPHHGPNHSDYIKLRVDDDGGMWLSVRDKNDTVETWLSPEVVEAIKLALTEPRTELPLRHLWLVGKDETR